LAYLGNQPSNNFVSLKRQVITGNGGSSYTLDHSVASVNDVAIFVNNVRQDPASYSISGTALTLGGTISSSDSCYVIFLGQALQTVTPDADTITTAMLKSNAVTTAKITDANVTSAKLSYPLTTFSSSGIDDNADATAITIDSSEGIHFGHPDTVDVGDAGISFNVANTTGLTRFSRSGTGSNTLVQFYNNNGNVGSIVTSGSATAYNTSSDYRLKENVSYDFDATSRLKQLKPARFNFIADADKTVDGFLAHEVSSVVPEAITGTKDAVKEDGNPEYQGIDQSKLVPLLVKTIQELEARITELENK